MADPQYGAPTEFRAGDTVQFRFRSPDYPVAAGWALQYTLSGQAKVAVSGVVDGDDWTVTLGANQTTALPHGTYAWALTVTLSGVRQTIAVGACAVLPDVVSLGAGALQSQDERELGYLNAEIAARAQSDHTEYTVDGRSLKRESLTELLEWRDQLRARIARRRRGGALGLVSVHFPGRGVGLRP